jgi:hypothetical protein
VIQFFPSFHPEEDLLKFSQQSSSKQQKVGIIDTLMRESSEVNIVMTSESEESQRASIGRAAYIFGVGFHPKMRFEDVAHHSSASAAIALKSNQNSAG